MLLISCVIFGAFQLQALLFFVLWTESDLVLVNVDYKVSLRFREVQKKLVCCACQVPFACIEKVQVVEAENGNEFALVVENMQGHAVLAVTEHLPENLDRLVELESEKSWEKTEA